MSQNGDLTWAAAIADAGSLLAGASAGTLQAEAMAAAGSLQAKAMAVAGTLQAQGSDGTLQAEGSAGSHLAIRSAEMLQAEGR